MSRDLLELISNWWLDAISDAPQDALLDETTAEQLPHPDDPALGVVLAGFVRNGLSLNIDDRDFNAYSLNPSCSSQFSNMHNQTWVVHHVDPSTWQCMWALDMADGAERPSAANSAIDASQRAFPDLCACSNEVEEEPDNLTEPFWYPR